MQTTVTTPKAPALTHFEKKADAVFQSLRNLGIDLSLDQVQAILAQAEGHDNPASLKEVLAGCAPKFCPHCGSAGTLKEVGSVFCEQGEWENNHYEGEGDAPQHQCTNCGRQFAGWDGI